MAARRIFNFKGYEVRMAHLCYIPPTTKKVPILEFFIFCVSNERNSYICTPIFEGIMAQHKSALKRIRQDIKKRDLNRYYHKTTRNAVRKLRAMTSKKEAQEYLPAVHAMIDKLAKKNIIHANKAGNLKSGLTVMVGKL